MRAKLLTSEERMLSYPWSSLGWYLSGTAHRPAWIRAERLLAACGLTDTPGGRQFETDLEERRRQEGGEDRWMPLRQGWCFGGDALKQKFLAEIDEQVKDHHPGDIRRESAEARAERIIAEELKRLGWSSADLSLRLKTDPDKLLIAQRLRAETILPVKWIAARLHLGTTRNATTRLQELRQRKARPSQPANV